VAELHGHRLQCYHLQAGRAERHELGGRVLEGGVILEEPELRVRAVTLDHGTPTLAYALEEAAHLNVRKERLVEDGLAAGPWLRELKTLVCRGELETIMTLPNGARDVVRAVAGRLLLERPGDKLVYATDFADTRANRRRIVELARGAHTLFCEAAFCETEVGQARATGHLTARACGEIAAEAGVGQLVPFHLSRRYERQPEIVLREVVAAFERIMVPDPLYELVFGDGGARAFTRGA
jgi:ribonuclease BN (tRNA processing enzyme)